MLFRYYWSFAGHLCFWTAKSVSLVLMDNLSYLGIIILFVSALILYHDEGHYRKKWRKETGKSDLLEFICLVLYFLVCLTFMYLCIGEWKIGDCYVQAIRFPHSQELLLTSSHITDGSLQYMEWRYRDCFWLLHAEGLKYNENRRFPAFISKLYFNFITHMVVEERLNKPSKCYLKRAPRFWRELTHAFPLAWHSWCWEKYV